MIKKKFWTPEMFTLWKAQKKLLKELNVNTERNVNLKSLLSKTPSRILEKVSKNIIYNLNSILVVLHTFSVKNIKTFIITPSTFSGALEPELAHLKLPFLESKLKALKTTAEALGIELIFVTVKGHSYNDKVKLIEKYITCQKMA